VQSYKKIIFYAARLNDFLYICSFNMETQSKNKRDFVHLHVHSHYSLLDGMATIPGLVNKAAADGMKAIALTDHGSMFGIKEFYDYAQKYNENHSEEEKIKPILGVEAYCARRTHLDKSEKDDRAGWHLIILAKNKTGYKNLCKLVSKSWLDGHYYKPRIDKEMLEKYHEGLIVSSACLGGEIPQKLLGGNARNVDEDTIPDSVGAIEENIVISETNKKNAVEAIKWFKNLFGDDYYLEIQRHKTDKEGADQEVYERQKEVNAAILELAQLTDTKVIATNDVHFTDEEHADAHDRLICLSTSKDLNDPKRMRYTKQEWLKTQAEMSKIFADLPDVLENTLEIADKVEYYDINSSAMMPAFDIPESFGTEEEYREKYTEEALKEEFNAEDESRFDKLGGYDKVIRIKLEADYLNSLTFEKAKKRYGDPIPEEVKERLDYELETMKIMGFPGYFLIVHDFIEAAKRMNVSVGPGRGSAAGSAVAYCLGITDIDPLRYDLLFERFLNPDRISMPDIDIDFDDDGRKEVLRYVTEKYGAEKVARIVTYGTMATKSSIKDVGRVQGLKPQETDRLTKQIPDKFPEDKDGNTPKMSISNCLKFVPELKDAYNSDDPNLSDTMKYAGMLEGTVRQVGVHACGVIIGADDLTNYVPLSTAKEKGSDEDVAVTQYEGTVIESIGLIKMDFLGLKTLSIIREALSNIKKSKGIDVDISKVPLDDKTTYKLYSEGNTVGTFQFESLGMQKYLRDLKPSQFEDLIAMNALYRPGPMQYIPSFIKRKLGEEKIEYDIPIMEKRLKETYGITVYQEQVMLLSRDLAGFTRGQSDELRKVMGKKLINKMGPLKEKFIAGGIKNGHDEKVLEKIWNDWTEFAKYAFNKSHSTCYSLVAYQTAWLKAHYPAEFMAANLTRNLDRQDEIAKFMDECRKMKIVVKGPDINESDLNFTVNSAGEIRFGLGGIKGVGSSAVDAIVAERDANGPFKSIFDFVERVSLNACKKNNIESLAYSGAFDNFREIRREQFSAAGSKDDSFIDTLIRYGNKFQEDKKSSAVSLFGDMASDTITRPQVPESPAMSNVSRLNKEKELVGMYLSSHPLNDYEIILNHVCSPLSEFKALKIPNNVGKEFYFGGIVTGFRTNIGKNGKPYGFIKIEDFSGSDEIALFGENFDKYSVYGKENLYLMMRGRMQWPRYVKEGREPEVEFGLMSVETLQEAVKTHIRSITVGIPLPMLDLGLISGLSMLVKNNQGNCTLLFNVVEDIEKGIKVTLTSALHKINVNKELIDFLDENNLAYKIN